MFLIAADVGLIRNAALTLIAKNRNNHATVQKL